LQLISSRVPKGALCAIAILSAATPARAELVLSELIVDLQSGKHVRDDVEIWNKSDARTFVAVEPRQIINPSLTNQSERRDPDPEKIGLLVSPTRMILEPGQRKLLRIATLAPASTREQVYRVTVKPVIAGVESPDSGLKILVGYDVLVLVRPLQALPNVTATRSGRTLTFNNQGNVSVEIVEGKQCNSSRAECKELPGKRLYPGASWTVELGSDLPAQYTLRSPGRSDRKTF
jgi:P pilus assembly chaperone PapD